MFSLEKQKTMILSDLEEYIENGDSVAIDNLLHNNPSLAKQRTSHDISPLLLACYYNKSQLVKIILKHIDQVDIYEAASANLLEEMTSLLTENPDLLSQYSPHGFTALSMAVHFGNEDIVRYLLRHGADPHLFSQNGYRVFPLHTAIDANFEVIAKMLIEAGAEVNSVQSSGMTPLHYAAQNGNIELLIILLEKGALVDYKNEQGMTPSDLALLKGHEEIAKILAI